MKRYVHIRNTFTCFLFFVLAAASCCAENDKALHFGASSFFGAMAQTSLYHKTEIGTSSTIVFGGLIGTVPGLMKEIFDDMQDDNKFCKDDMIANIAGSFTGALVSGALNHVVYVRMRHGKEKELLVCLKYEF